MVSIIIPTFNYGKYITSALESISAQVYKNYEIIIIDNCSKDDTENIVKNFRKGFKGKLTYIRHSVNKGFPYSLNHGLKLASGKYVNFLSADDILLPTFLKSSIEVFNRNKKSDLVFSPSIYINDKGIETGRQKNKSQKYFRKNQYLKLIIGNYLSLVSVLVKKDVLKKAGFFNTKLKYIPDWDMWIKLSRLTSFNYLPEYLTQYRIHRSGLTGDLKRNFQNIGIEKEIMLTETIKSEMPKQLKYWAPFLFLDAYLPRNRFPTFLVRLFSLIATGVSILCSLILKRFF